MANNSSKDMNAFSRFLKLELSPPKNKQNHNNNITTQNSRCRVIKSEEIK